MKKTGILLINLGTPSHATTKGVRSYLKDFLSDPRVIDLPWIARKILLYLFILPFRVPRSTEAYRAIWDEQRGSPLFFYTQDLAKGLQKHLGESYEVGVGMRYGDPDLINAFKKLLLRSEKIIIVPLFPQYASATTGSILEKIARMLQDRTNIPALEIISDFYDYPDYIAAKADMISSFLTEFKPDKVLFSYHSLPLRQLRNSGNHCASICFEDKPCPRINQNNRFCYRAQCYETSRLLMTRLNITHGEVVFQSRLGRTPWCGPELQSTMTKAREAGAKRLLIACPSFVTDCLETLEEIGIRAKAHWQALGGEAFMLVPCLNADQHWIQALARMVTLKT